jgi:hypothetical protein
MNIKSRTEIRPFLFFGTTPWLLACGFSTAIVFSYSSLILHRYFNAMHKSGPKPSARIEYPTVQEVKAWLEKNDDDSLDNIPSIAADNLGFFLFLKFCAANGDLPCALFIEAVAKFKVGTTRFVFLLKQHHRPQYLFVQRRH